jgi:uncharacterized lipoprotein YmbA
MVHRTIRLVAIVVLAATTVGCGLLGPSATAKFYTLSSMAKPEGEPSASYAVGVGSVSIPSAVDRPQFVVQVSENRVELDEFNRWAGPLDETIARAVAGNLAVLLGTEDVAVAPLANLNPVYLVTIDVQRFDSLRGEAVIVDALWAARQTKGKAIRNGRTLTREKVKDDSFDALAAAHSRALARLSEDIAVAIQTMAEQKK